MKLDRNRQAWFGQYPALKDWSQQWPSLNTGNGWWNWRLRKQGWKL